MIIIIAWRLTQTIIKVLKKIIKLKKLLMKMRRKNSNKKLKLKII